MRSRATAETDTPELLKAVRELDALVAEKVMGWILVEAEHRGPASHFFTPSGIAPGNKERTMLPHFSTDIAAAWYVAEKMRSLGHKISIRDRASYPWACWLCVDPGLKSERVVLENGDTAPLAICLAALKAVEAP